MFCTVLTQEILNHQINNQNLMYSLIGHLNDGCKNNMLRNVYSFTITLFINLVLFCFYLLACGHVQYLNFSADISASKSLLFVSLETPKRTLAVPEGVTMITDPSPPRARGQRS